MGAVDAPSGSWSTSNPSLSGSRLAPGMVLGDYRIGSPLWPLRIADAYRAEGPRGAATIYVVHARIAEHATVRDHVIAGTRAAAALPEHKHLVHTIAAGLTGNVLWIATEEIEGSLVRDLLAKKRAANGGGLGARATGNLIAGVAAAVADTPHGALAAESVVVSRTGRIRVIDLALAQGTIAAIQAGLVPAAGGIAPELASGGAAGAAADVYGIGALLYEALVGQGLERGGPRPSDVVGGLTSQIDEVVARACHRDPGKRFGRPDVLGEVVAEALTTGAAVATPAPADDAPALAHQVSLAASIGAPAATAAPAAAAMSADPVLAAALADSTEKWLITKGRLDYGPFSLADVVAQIEHGDIEAGNIIMDKDSGARIEIGAHPLLGPMVEAARQRRDDLRRAQAEVAVQRADKKRGALLYAMIGLGVIGVGGLVYALVATDLIINHEAKQEKLESIAAVEGSTLEVTLSVPKKPPPARRATTGRRRSAAGGPGFQQGTEDLSLDLSDDSDEGSETLGMDQVYAVYSRYGGQLGRCLASTGARAANIYINIDGPSGRVKFVKINGKTSGPLFNCLGRVLRSMKFPSINGPRTRAEFDISM